MMTLVHYGLGNIQAFVNIYKRLNIPVAVADTTEQLSQAEKIILPGVGAFDWAMTLLNGSGMRSCLDEMVMKKKCPVLGVCVGMQIMARSSEEGKMPGLGWIDAEVRRFRQTDGIGTIHLPQMGWNDVRPADSVTLFQGMKEPRFYFLHSYYFVPKTPNVVLAETDYHGRYASAVRSGNIYGTQFHPEKSHGWGIQLLRNFAEL